MIEVLTVVAALLVVGVLIYLITGNILVSLMENRTTTKALKATVQDNHRKALRAHDAHVILQEVQSSYSLISGILSDEESEKIQRQIAELSGTVTTVYDEFNVLAKTCDPYIGNYTDAQLRLMDHSYKEVSRHVSEVLPELNSLKECLNILIRIQGRRTE